MVTNKGLERREKINEISSKNSVFKKRTGNQKYIVFRDKVLKYTIGNQEEKERVCAECRKLGISDAEMNWAE